jgi:hypothetical protein
MNYLIDMSDVWRKERASTQMTIGKLITKLETFPKDKEIEKLSNPHSYRGYYSDLGLQISGITTTVGETIDFLYNRCLNETYHGYKGGEYVMDKDTPLFEAFWGHTGNKIIDVIDDDGILTFKTQAED